MKFKLKSIFIFITLLFLAGISCGDDDSTSDSAELEMCLSELSTPEQPAEITLAELLSETEEVLSNGTVCTIKNYEWAPGNSESILLDPTSDVIYPGGLIKSGSLADGSYTPINADRSSITISHSANGESKVVDNPALSNVRNAVKELTDQVTISPASIVAEIKEIFSSEHLKLSIKGNYDGLFADVSAKFDFQNSQIKSRFLVEFSQVYYSVDVDGKNKASDWFKEEADFCNALTLFPTYVSSVKYGRVGMLAIESTMDKTEVLAALSASFSGISQSGGFDVATDYSMVWNASSFKLLLVGGAPDDGVEAVNSVSGFNEWIANGGIYSETSPGSPISYTLRYLDGSIAKIVKSGEYSVRECIPAPETMEISFTPVDKTVCPNRVGSGDREFDGNGPIQKAKVRIYIVNEKEIWAEINYNVKETISDWTEGNYSDSYKIFDIETSMYSGYTIKDILSPSEFSTPNYPDEGIEDTSNSIVEYPSMISNTTLVKKFTMVGDTSGDDLDSNLNVEDCVNRDWSYLSVDFNPIRLALER